MKKVFLIVFVFIQLVCGAVLSVTPGLDNRLSHDQYMVTYDGVLDGWIVGTFDSWYVTNYRISGSLTYTLTDNENGIYAINSTTGIISIADNEALVDGIDTLKVLVTLDDQSETYNVFVTVKDVSDVVHVNPEAATNGTGTRVSPKNTWAGMVFEPGKMYVQERGTTSSVGINLNVNGTAENPIILGAYGTGAKPIINTNYAGYGITVRADYSEIYEFNLIDNIGAISVPPESAIYQHHVWSDITCSGSSGAEAQVYIHKPANGTAPPYYWWDFDIKMYDFQITGTGDAATKSPYGMKLEGGTVYIRNAKTINNRYQGISQPFMAHGNHVIGLLSYGNSHYAIEFGGRNITLEQSYLEGGWAAFILADAGTDTLWAHHNEMVGGGYRGTVWLSGDGNHFQSTGWEGAPTVHARNITIENNIIRGSTDVQNAGIVVTKAINDLRIRKNYIHDHPTGIKLSTVTAYLDSLRNIQIDQNVFYDIENYDIYNLHATEIYVRNNSMTGATFSTPSMYFMNNFYKTLTSPGPSNNNIDLDAIDPATYFVNWPANDLRLKSTATLAIDQGSNVGLTKDIDGVAIPQGTGPDIGAYEYASGGGGTPYEDMIALWAFEEGSGTTAQDSTDNNHDGTLTNGAAFSGDSQVGSYSVLLDGDNDYVNTGTIGLGSQFTIAMWTKIPSSGVSSIQTLFANSNSGSTTNGIRIFVNTSGTTDRKIIVETANGTTTNQAYTATSAFDFDQWNHVAIVVDKTNGKALIYYNGDKITTDSLIRNDFGTNQAVHLGQMTNDTYTMKGNLDDVRIYDYLLSASEIDALADTTIVPSVTISATDASASEAGQGTGTFTVSRTSSTGNLSVNYTKTGTTSSGDYTETLTGSVTISDGNTTATITITPVDDATYEGNETVILTLGSGSGYTVGSPSSDTVTIADNDPSYADMIALWAFEEGSGTTAQDSTSNNHDGTLTNGASFSGDSQVGSYSVLLDGDDDYVNTGTIDLGSQFTIAMWTKIPSSGVSSIQTLFANSNSGSTTNGIRIFVNTSGTTDRKIIVETANGTTTNQAYTATSAFDFDQWNHVAIVVDKTNGKALIYHNGDKITTDSLIRNDFGTNQAVHLGQMTNNTYTMKGNQDDVRIYNYLLSESEIDALANGGNPPEVTISATDASASEAGQGTGTFTVSRTSTIGNLSVSYSKTGTTSSGDYTETLTGSVTISDGNSTATVTITPVDDATIEGDETVILTLGSGSGYTVGTPSSATVTITDNDFPEVTISATDASASEASQGTGTFTVSRTSTIGNLSVSYSKTGTTLSGDYTETLTGSVTISDGNSTATITITPVDDATIEGDETVILTLGSGTGYTVGTPSEATVTITDNDYPEVTISATDASASEAGQGTGTFTVSRTSTIGNLSVNYTKTGTTSSGDYTETLTGSVAISDGNSTATITITPVDDATDENDETVILTLGSGSGYTVGSPSAATVTIADNDPLYEDMVAFWAFEEGSGTTAQDSTVNNHDGTLTNGAAFNADEKYGAYSMYLDGSNDYMNAGTIDLGSQFTISLWAKIPSSGVNDLQTLFANASSGSTQNGIKIFVNTYQTTDRKIIVETGNGSSSNPALTSTNVFAWDQWNHVVVVVDKTNGKARIYYNGTNVTADSLIRSDFGTNQAVHLGQTTNNSAWMKGYLDQVRIYNRMLTSSEAANVLKGALLPSGEISGSSVSVYPNPFRDELILRNVQDVIRVELVNMDGKILLIRSNTGQPEMKIDTGSLVSGVYIVRLIRSTGETSVYKVVKNPW